MSLPLILTLGRIFLAPLFLLLYFYPNTFGLSALHLPYALIAIAVVSELSDIFDGFAARRMGLVTDLGKLLDPMADTIFRLSVFFTLTQGMIALPMILVLLMFYREMLITTLRTICALGGTALAARMSGKVKAVLQACALFLILVAMIPHAMGMISLDLLQRMSFYSVLFVTLYSIGSGIEYIVVNRKYIAKAIT